VTWAFAIGFAILASSVGGASSQLEGVRSPPTLSFLAFNVLYNSTEIEKSIDVIEVAHPDLVCLTELTPRFAARFEARLAKKYPHRVFRARKGTWGVGLASRYPLSDARLFEQKPHKIPAMESKIHLKRTTLQLACLHLFPPVGKHRASDGFLETMEKNAELRRKQAAYILNRYAKLKGPVILAGDMNEQAGGRAIETFQAGGYVRSCGAPSSDCGATFPGATSALPAVLEIDHILGRGVSFESARVARGGGSDHFAVYAEFRVP
jgi:endonuclease/exonuclease/phosphatase (EEP) superfamily protein YafD